jgi:hypothetical protein
VKKLEKEENKLDKLIESLQVRHKKMLKSKKNDLRLDLNKDLDQYFMNKNYILLHQIPENSEVKLNVPVNQVYFEQLNEQLKTVESSLSFPSIKFKLKPISNSSVCFVSLSFLLMFLLNHNYFVLKL